MLTCAVTVLALFASVQGRAVNISNTWVLPEEGFPVFYRYFRDRISWYEADAVCQFHHANLVTVDTTAQYDAVRAYLKELDISSAVWVGLIRSNPDGDFTWTDYRGLSSDGYWSSAPDARAAPLCAAADPVADYRWEARACGGPTVASFICELPVPQWALGNEGCMVRALPALTVLYLPESAAVQLTADCGLAGVRRVQCTGNVKREDLLKDLSCEEEEESSTSGTVTAVENTYSTTTDTINNVTDQDTTTEVTTENIVTEQQDITSKSTGLPSTQTPYYFPVVQDNTQSKQQTILNKLNAIYSNKHTNFDLLHNNNLQSNDIPKIATDENELTLEQSEKIEDEKHLHHKMLHDELARHGNFETIFTQPTDHFVPPLVMAKAKVSDDMTVLSLAEKHAQQLAERSFGKHYLMNEHNDQLHMNNNHKIGPRLTTEEPNKVEIIDKPLVMTFQSLQTKDGIKKDKLKSNLPKKYKEKYDDPKGKHLKVDNKLIKFEKSTEGTSTQTESTTKIIQTTESLVTKDLKLEEDSSIDLTVVLKEPIVEADRKLNYSGDVANIKTIQNSSPESETTSTEKITSESPILTTTDNTHDVAMTHEIIKITIIDEATSSPTHTVFDLTTRMPDNKVLANNDNIFLTTQRFIEDTTNVNVKTTDNTMNKTNDAEVTINPDINNKSTTINHLTKVAVKIDSEDISNDQKETITPEKNLTTKYINPIISTTTTEKSTSIGTELHSTTIQIPDITTKDKTHDSSTTESYEENGEFNSTDISSETIDDFQSPLLSAANEPLHRPNRSRRPQPPPNRLNKFNPFRILG